MSSAEAAAIAIGMVVALTSGIAAARGLAQAHVR
jgi:hypothetical protein